MALAWWRDDSGEWVKVHIAAFLPGPNMCWPCVVMYRDADKARTLVCVPLYDERTRVSRFRDR